VAEFLTALNAVMPVFLIAGSGFAMRKLSWLTSEADTSLLRVTINLLVPCLAFDSLLGNEAFANRSNLVLPPLVGFGTIVCGLLAASGAATLFRKSPPQVRRTFAYSVAIYNYGYIPIPLALALFDRETVGVLFVHNVGVEIAFWIFGLLLLAGIGLRTSWRRLLNAPLITIVVTLSLNALISRDDMPAFFMNAVRPLGQCAIPIGLVLIGATMADHAHEFVRSHGGPVMALASVLRLGLLPASFLLIARFLPLSVELKRVVVLQAAMPAAVFPIVLTRHYGGDPVTALRVVVATSALGLVTIPLWIRLGLKWMGL
jgi:predicted permease